MEESDIVGPMEDDDGSRGSKKDSSKVSSNVEGADEDWGEEGWTDLFR